jgi:hypothetical protein
VRIDAVQDVEAAVAGAFRGGQPQAAAGVDQTRGDDEAADVDPRGVGRDGHGPIDRDDLAVADKDRALHRTGFRLGEDTSADEGQCPGGRGRLPFGEHEGTREQTTEEAEERGGETTGVSCVHGRPCIPGGLGRLRETGRRER